MADANNAIALQVNSGGGQNELLKTIQAMSTIQQAQAHTGLYQLQAEQQARKLYAIKQWQDTGDLNAIAAHDPEMAGKLQAFVKERQGQDMLAQYGQDRNVDALAARPDIQKMVYDARKAGDESVAKRFEVMGQIGNMAVSDPSAPGRAQALALGIQHGIFTPDQARAAFELPHEQWMNRAEQFRAVGQSSNDYSLNSGQRAGNEARAKAPFEFEKFGEGEQVISKAALAHNQNILMQNAQRMIQSGGNAGPNPPPGYAATPDNPRGTVGPAVIGATAGEIEDQKKAVGDWWKNSEEIGTAATNAKQQKAMLGVMEADAKKFGTGAYANAQYWAAKGIQPMLNAFGIHNLDEAVGSYERFGKNRGEVMRGAVKEVSPRASFQEFQMIGDTLLNEKMTPTGMGLLLHQMHSVYDAKIAKEQVFQNWSERNGKNSQKFSSEWNANVNPAMFMVSRLPAEQQQKLFESLAQKPGGAALIKKIGASAKWLKDNGFNDQ